MFVFHGYMANVPILFPLPGFSLQNYKHNHILTIINIIVITASLIITTTVLIIYIIAIIISSIAIIMIMIFHTGSKQNQEEMVLLISPSLPLLLIIPSLSHSYITIIITWS